METSTFFGVLLLLVCLGVTGFVIYWFGFHQKKKQSDSTDYLMPLNFVVSKVTVA